MGVAVSSFVIPTLVSVPPTPATPLRSQRVLVVVPGVGRVGAREALEVLLRLAVPQRVGGGERRRVDGVVLAEDGAGEFQSEVLRRVGRAVGGQVGQRPRAREQRRQAARARQVLRHQARARVPRGAPARLLQRLAQPLRLRAGRRALPECQHPIFVYFVDPSRWLLPSGASRCSGVRYLRRCILAFYDSIATTFIGIPDTILEARIGNFNI